MSRKYRGTKMRYLRGQFLRARRLWLQTVSLPASGQKIFKHLHDSRQYGTDLRLQTWFVIIPFLSSSDHRKPYPFKWIFSRFSYICFITRFCARLHRKEMRAMLTRILRIPSSPRWKMYTVRMQPCRKFERWMRHGNWAMQVQSWVHGTWLLPMHSVSPRFHKQRLHV